MEQAWWANQGHQRALEQRSRARIASSRRFSLVAGSALLCWGLIVILAGGRYLFLLPNREATSLRSATSGALGPYEGYLEGCFRDCEGFSSLELAKAACQAADDCGGVTFVPFEKQGLRYELRSGTRPVPTSDGQRSFVLGRKIDEEERLQRIISRKKVSRGATGAADKENQGESETSVGGSLSLNTFHIEKDVEGENDVENGLRGRDTFEEDAALDTEEEGSEAEEESALDSDSDELQQKDRRPHRLDSLLDSDLNALDGPITLDEGEDDGLRTFDAWQPDEHDDIDLDDIGTDIDGQPTIFIGIASYRDAMCHETIERALVKAKFPNRLRFGIVEQNESGDVPCFYTELSCKDGPDQILCKFRDQIRVHRVAARQARGPTFGRHRADSLYRGETYALQLDAHMFFVDNWDVEMIAQFESTGNEYAILTNYPSDVADFDAEKGVGKRATTPALCESKFVDNLMTRHGSAKEFLPPKDIASPILQIWWAAGVSFSRGHRIVRVPYDGYLPMIFNGEETSMAYRLWTHGYDFYTFHHSLVFHPYHRAAAPPLFWENEAKDTKKRKNDLLKSQNRLLYIYGLGERSPIDLTDVDKYGLGDVRPIEKFWKLFGVDYSKRTVANNCLAATSASIHRALVPFVRADKRGIDYSHVTPPINFRKAATRAIKGLGEYAGLQLENAKAVVDSPGLRG